MFKPTYKDWPLGYRRLLQFTVLAMLLSLTAFRLGVLPRWRSLDDLQEQIGEEHQKLDKVGIALDAETLGAHLQTCKIMLNGAEDKTGLITLANDTLSKASAAFQAEIAQSYHPESPNSANATTLFVNTATRIDYKDLFDRTSSEFKEQKIVLAENSLEPEKEKENPEPVYQLILKLWTIRHCVRNAIANHLEIVPTEQKSADIQAMKTMAYLLGQPTPQAYLLEFRIRLALTGTMENFLNFLKSLQQGDTFLPVRNLMIYSLPPDKFAPGDKQVLERYQFRIVCSSFFPAESDNPAGNAKEK